MNIVKHNYNVKKLNKFSTVIKFIFLKYLALFFIIFFFFYETNWNIKKIFQIYLLNMKFITQIKFVELFINIIIIIIINYYY
jgi:hypothetical protein